MTGDVLLGGERGFRLQPESWLAEGTTRAELLDTVRPLLRAADLAAVEAHGDPVADGARETLRAVLSA